MIENLNDALTGPEFESIGSKSGHNPEIQRLSFKLYENLLELYGPGQEFDAYKIDFEYVEPENIFYLLNILKSQNLIEKIKNTYSKFRLKKMN